MPRTNSSPGLPYERVVALALALLEVEESTSYGTPALKVRGKLMTRLWEDGETLVCRTTWDDRERLLNLHPEVCFLTDHYLEHPYLLVRLAAVTEALMVDLLRDAWREVAPARLVRALAGG